MRFDWLTRMRDHQALIKMHHALLNAHRALTETPQSERQLFKNLRPAAIVLARKLDAMRSAWAWLEVNSPSLTARWSKSHEATCIRRVVKRMLSVEYAKPPGEEKRAILSPRTIEVSCGLFDERHSFAKEIFECAGRGKTVNEGIAFEGRAAIAKLRFGPSY